MEKTKGEKDRANGPIETLLDAYQAVSFDLADSDARQSAALETIRRELVDVTGRSKDLEAIRHELAGIRELMAKDIAMKTAKSLQYEGLNTPTTAGLKSAFKYNEKLLGPTEVE